MVQADGIRLAVWHADFSRDGPGLLLRDLLREQPAALLDEIARLHPDLLLLTRFDWDYEGRALAALREALRRRGLNFTEAHAPPQNRGLATEFDLDGDGRLHGRGDSQGWGAFRGDGSMALLSRLPLGEVQDFSAVLWRDLPGADMSAAHPEQRLAASAFWVVPFELPGGGGQAHLLAFAATPALPGRDALRNAAEAEFWLHWLSGAFGPVPPGPFLLAGQPNRAPGQGDPAPFSGLQGHPRLGPALHGSSSRLPSGEAALTALLAGPEWQVAALGRGAADHPEKRVFHHVLWADLRLSAPFP